jgi:MFS family permease
VPDQRWINLFAAIAAITVFGFALGLMFPLLSLIMEREGISPDIIGYNTAMQPLGILLSGFVVPSAVKAWGGRNVVISAAFLCAAIILVYPMVAIAPWWFVLRVIQGFAVSTLFSVSEAWVVRFAAGKYRSRILALYAGVLSVSFAGGPAIIAWTGIDTMLPFVIGACVLIAATAPIFLLKDNRSEEEDANAAMSIASFAPKAPILLLAVGMFAIIDAANLGFLPVYGVKKGMDREVASLALTAFIIGNSVLQFPIGWLADHMSKRTVMAGCGIATAIGSALIPLSFGTWLLWPVLLVTGAASAGIYTVALSELGDRFTGAELVSGTASFATMWGLGALLGALAAGWAFQIFGPDGLPYTLAALFAAFILAMTGRRLAVRA